MNEETVCCVSLTFICVIQSSDTFFPAFLKSKNNFGVPVVLCFMCLAAFVKWTRRPMFFCFVDIHLCDTIEWYSCVSRRLLNERGDRMIFLFFCFVHIHLGASHTFVDRMLCRRYSLIARSILPSLKSNKYWSLTMIYYNIINPEEEITHFLCFAW